MVSHCHVNRRQFLQRTLTGVSAGLLAGCQPCGLLGGKEKPKKPNILFVIVDDLRPEMGCYGNQDTEQAGKQVAVELYDHQVDPHENINVAAQADYADQVEPLAQQLKAGWKAAQPESQTVHVHSKEKG